MPEPIERVQDLELVITLSLTDKPLDHKLAREESDVDLRVEGMQDGRNPDTTFCEPVEGSSDAAQVQNLDCVLTITEVGTQDQLGQDSGLAPEEFWEIDRRMETMRAGRTAERVGRRKRKRGVSWSG